MDIKRKKQCGGWSEKEFEATGKKMLQSHGVYEGSTLKREKLYISLHNIFESLSHTLEIFQIIIIVIIMNNR